MTAANMQERCAHLIACASVVYVGVHALHLVSHRGHLPHDQTDARVGEEHDEERYEENDGRSVDLEYLPARRTPDAHAHVHVLVQSDLDHLFAVDDWQRKQERADPCEQNHELGTLARTRVARLERMQYGHVALCFVTFKRTKLIKLLFNTA